MLLNMSLEQGVIKAYQSVSGFHIEQGLRKVKCRIAAVGVDVLQIADPVLPKRGLACTSLGSLTFRERRILLVYRVIMKTLGGSPLN
jgi:hypothetical protein